MPFSKDNHAIDSAIFKLALPSLATLLAEPLLIAADSTMVGWLGTHQLAGLSLASTVLTAIVGLCIFLAYATTATTARMVGADRPAVGLQHGINGIWLAAILGVTLSVVLFSFAPAILALFNPNDAVLLDAVRYTRFSSLGLPAMLLVLAATGTLRGFADAQTPLRATIAGALLNIPLNYLLIYVVDLGVGGAGLGTAIAQSLMASYLCFVVYRRAVQLNVRPLPTGVGVLRSLREALPLIVRTASLRGTILLQIAAATALGTVALASNQIVMMVWNFAAYGLDALATAAQILVGQSLGSKNRERVHAVLRRCLTWGLRTGTVLCAVLAILSVIIPQFISGDDAVRWLSTQTLWVTSAALPIASIAYVLDGVLIGAGDTRKLAKYMLLALAAFSPFALAIVIWGTHWGTAGMLLLWASYAVLFMAVRGLTMLYRVRTTF